MMHGLFLALFAATILTTAPFVLRRAEAAGFSPRLVQQGWRAAAGGALASLALAVPVFTTDLWTSPARAVGLTPDIAIVDVPLPVQIAVAASVLLGLIGGWLLNPASWNGRSFAGQLVIDEWVASLAVDLVLWAIVAFVLVLFLSRTSVPTNTTSR